MHDRDVEDLVRAGLAAAAESADVHGVAVADVRRTVATRRRRRQLVAAAAAAVVVVAATAVFVGGGTEDPPPVATEATGATDGASDPGWRTESWGALSVDVPADWSHGGAPMGLGRSKSACPPRLVRAETEVSGWVGRPILLSDVCLLYPWIEHDPQLEDPTPYVWLGGEVEVGTVTYPSGIVQETVEVEGERLTVATADAALRARIIASARPVETCPASVAEIPDGSSGTSVEGRGEPIDASVCAYRLEDGEFRLTFAATATAELVDRVWSAQSRARAVGAESDCSREVREYVGVQARYDDPFGAEPLLQRASFRLGCTGEVDLGQGARGPLRTKVVTEGVVPWAEIPGISAVVHAPFDAQFLAPWLIGLQG